MGAGGDLAYCGVQQLRGEASRVGASQFGWSWGSFGVLWPWLAGAAGLALFGLCCHNSPELQITGTDPQGKAHLIMEHDLASAAVCPRVPWASWKRVTLRSRTMQNLFLGCKSISMYEPFPAGATIYKPMAGGNHMLLPACDRFMLLEQWKPVVLMR